MVRREDDRSAALRAAGAEVVVGDLLEPADVYRVVSGCRRPLTGPSVRDRGRIELPFGRGKTNPVSTADVARVVASVLADPAPHLGRIYELTGPRSQDMDGLAREYSDALNRDITYSDISPEDWERELKRARLPEHLTRHLVTMAELNRAGRYDRLTDGVQRVTGRSAMSVREFVSLHAGEFGRRSHAQHAASR